jgi:hypothetical protein
MPPFKLCLPLYWDTSPSLHPNELPPRFELGAVDSKSTVLTNYTIGAGIVLVVVFSLTSFMYFIIISETEKRPAEVFATIIGITVKYMEYIRPIVLANILINKNE